jgi:hypothetical protein
VNSLFDRGGPRGSFDQRNIGFTAVSAPAAVIVLGAPGVRLENTIVRNAKSTAIAIDASSVVIDGCEASGSAADGIRVLSGSGVQIHNCNLFGNAGFGLNNLGPSQVDATLNWWGDPAGPYAPNGDGVSGNVLFEPQLIAPTH